MYMLEQKRRDDWLRTAYQTCILANLWINKGSGYSIGSFPYCEQYKKISDPSMDKKAFINLGAILFNGDN